MFGACSQLPSLRDWLSVSGRLKNRGAVTVVSLGFSTRGLGQHHLARQAAERRQVARDAMGAD
ncbi:hypothetical protein RISK_005830 [Rhodopirellula islandica]|uniref:Uncharacterized protein n=1 Tax=Rhodopirellula islandica TaxID=595434 RepID=A0A0J1B5R2_RHOIS|nr:hypothetical protein RISK_005830 [Rhodopirellula islandica]